MERHYKFCICCRRTLTQSELARELYVEDKDGIVCATCAQRRDEAPEGAHGKQPGKSEAGQPQLISAAGDGQQRHFIAIQDHLERIHRALIFERSSSWNVLAAVSQCLAIGILLTAAFRWLQSPQDLLLVALIFQVMALTFFLKGK